MSCCNLKITIDEATNIPVVTIPQAVWAVATLCRVIRWYYMECYNTASGMSCCNTIGWYKCCFSNSYNTASGMSCCNIKLAPHQLVVRWLQYRKRYELLQLLNQQEVVSLKNCYNTASGMSCCNLLYTLLMLVRLTVTIPQAVWAVATAEDT